MTNMKLTALCKEKGIKCYSGKNKEVLVDMLSKSNKLQLSTPKIDAETDVKVKPIVKVEMTTIIEDLETIKSILENKEAQKGLIALYTQSQSECTRNKRCGMEVGMSREKDQGAVLKLFLGSRINLDIDNTLPEVT